MFFDWLSVYQDFDYQLPLIAGRHFIAVDSVTGECLGTKQDTLNHAGSYSTSINIRVSGNRVTVTGNPSRVDRIENLFGFASLDQCIEVYNRILAQYGLPPFTKCTKVWRTIPEGGKGSKVKTFTDGAVFTEIHITQNQSIGSCQYDTRDKGLFSSGDVDCFIKAHSTLPYRNSIPRLHTNGKTCDWLSKKGKGGSLIYPSIYNKGYELELHALPKIKRACGEDSPEAIYLQSVIDYCYSQGVTRFELKLKSAYLRREDLRFYGLRPRSFERLRTLMNDFLSLHKKLKVEAMNLETISQKLVNEGVVDNTRAANVTTLYAIQWMHGQNFDLNKKQVQTHRARLRKIGIDIAMPCDISKFSLITVRESHALTVSNLACPDWYRKPSVNHLQVAA